MIAPDLQRLAVPVGDLTLFDANPRRGDVAAIARSLETFGQRKPIVATRSGVVVAGNHTLMAARELMWTDIAVVWVDDDPTTASAYSLADNRTAELGHYDTMQLAQLIAEVTAADERLIEAISYDAAELDDLLAKLDEQAAAPVVMEHVQPLTRTGHGSEGSFVEPSSVSRYELYQAKAVRSIVLDYPLDVYERLAANCLALRESRGLDSTAELFVALVDEAT